MRPFSLLCLARWSARAASIAGATLLLAAHASVHGTLVTDAMNYVARPGPASPGAAL